MFSKEERVCLFLVLGVLVGLWEVEEIVVRWEGDVVVDWVVEVIFCDWGWNWEREGFGFGIYDVFVEFFGDVMMISKIMLWCGLDNLKFICVDDYDVKGLMCFLNDM